MTRKAMFFGQNAVNGDCPEYGGWWGILNGCVPDARDLAIAFANDAFEAQARFSGYNIAGNRVPWVLTLDATKEEWINQQRIFQAAAQPGDLFVLGNSGHGGTYQKTDGSVGQTLCFADGQITDQEQHELYAAWPEGTKAVYILDSCYSGGLDRDRLKFTPKAAPKWVSDRNPAWDPLPKAEVKAAVVLLCASRDDETSADGPHNGAFTGSLLAVWDQARRQGKRLTWQDWLLATQEVMAPSFDQHPVFKVLGAGQSLLGELAF